MKKIIMAVLLMGLAYGVRAEQRVGVFASGMISSGDKSGSAFGGGLKYEWLFMQNLGVDLRAGYLNDSSTGLIPLEFGPVFVIPLDPVSLTLGAGGLYGIPTDSSIDSALGFYASAGVRGPISGGMEWFAEAQYAYLKGDDKKTTTYNARGYTTTSSAHLDFSAIGLNAGVLWKF
ncbi:MAG: hypothetical protein V2A34_16025 [Lentisphaerota bacterium]